MDENNFYGWKPGEIIDNYEIIQEIGRGGMGVVYKALEKNPQRLVAIKIILEKNMRSKKRFCREVELTAKLEHKNIVKVYKAGEINDWMFLVMEYIEGVILDYLIEKNKLSLSQSLDIVIQTGNGLAYAHRCQIVHRDVKPGNIIVQENGIAKIMDFGVAKNTANDKNNLTKTGSLIGTLLYMAPEQLITKNRKISPQVDIYALGAILYEVIANRPMISGQNVYETYYNIRKYKPEKLSSYNSQASNKLQLIWEKSIARKRQRYLTMSLFINDLHNFVNNKKISAKKIRNYSLPSVITMIVIIILLLALPRFFISPIAKHSPEDLYFEGIIEFDNHNYQTSYKILSSIDNQNSYAMLPYYLGACLYKIEESKQENKDIQKVEEAIAFFKKAYLIFNHDVNIIAALGKSYFLIEDYSRAKEYFSKCIAITPGNSEYYGHLAEIYLIQKEYDACQKNIKKAIALEQGNLKATDIMLKLSMEAPHLQSLNWRLLDHTTTSLERVESPVLSRDNFLRIERNTYREYIFSSQAEKNESFYIYLAVNTYLYDKKLDINELAQGKILFQNILENPDKDTFTRYLAAYSLCVLHEFETLAKYLETLDSSGKIIVHAVLRQKHIPSILADISQCFEEIKKNSFEKNDKVFLFQLLAQSYYSRSERYYQVESNYQTENILSLLIDFPDDNVKVAAASSLVNIFHFDSLEGNKAFNILRNMTLHLNISIRSYAYFYLFNSYHSEKNNFEYILLYKQGLRDTESSINLLCLSFFYKFSQIVLPENTITIFVVSGAIKIKNRDFIYQISNELRLLIQKDMQSKLALRAACIWAFSVNDINVVIQFIKENEQLSTLCRYIIIRVFLLSKLIENASDFIRDIASIQDIQKIIEYLNKQDDVVLKANLYFFMTIFIPIKIEDNMDKHVKSSILNATGLNLTSRFFPSSNNAHLEILNQYVNKIPLLSQSSYASIALLVNDQQKIHLCQKLLFENNFAAKRGFSEGLYRSVHVKLSSIEQEIKNRFDYLKPYNPYRIEEINQMYYQSILNCKAKTRREVYDVFNNIISLYQNPECYYERALVYLSWGEIVKARQDLLQAQSLLPEEYRYTVELANVEYQMGYIENSKILLEKIQKQEQNPFILRKIAGLYTQFNEYQQANIIHKILFTYDPYDKENLIQIIENYCILQNYQYACIYFYWLKKNCERKYTNTLDIEDLLTQRNFNTKGKNFSLIKKEIAKLAK